MPRIYTWIYRAYTGPFLANLAIILFILALNMLLTILDKLAGRGLEAMTWVEIFLRAGEIYLLLGLPIAILAGALITFGNLTERKELAALKASGTHPLRLYIPLMGVAVLFSLVSLYLSFQAIPQTHQRLWNLVYNIASTKPTMQLQAGRFYQDIDGFAIRVSDIDESTDMVYDVLIYDYSLPNESAEVIIADSGKLVTDGKSELLMWLYDGVKHEDNLQEYGRTYFDTLMVRIAMEGFSQDTAQGQFSHFRFLTMNQLTTAIDSLQDQLIHLDSKFKHSIFKTLPIDHQPITANYPKDSLLSIFTPTSYVSAALGQAKSIQKQAGFHASLMKNQTTRLNKHLYEWHKRIADPMNCLLFMVLGLSLGILLKKGGLALPGMIALGFLVLAYLLQGMGKDFSERGVFTPWVGAWISMLLLGPPSIFLTYMAITDKRMAIQRKISQLWQLELSKKLKR